MVADALPVYLAVVIGLAFLLLMVVFRSLLPDRHASDHRSDDDHVLV